MSDSSEKPIYFDNAATSYPKPASVYAAHDQYFRHAGNPGRAAHELALNSARKIFDVRQNLARFLGVSNSERVIFTPGCTYSINMVLRGLPLKEGDCVVTGPLEHNAVTRTLHELHKKLNLKVVVLPYARRGIIDQVELERYLDNCRPALCVVSEASNVTGERLSLEVVASVCARKEVPLLVDAAQTAGSEFDSPGQYPGVSFWAAPGHKGLFGSAGAGLLFVRDSDSLSPTIFGGTGSASESLDMPPDLPDRLEPGSLPVPAIAAMGAGVEFIENTGAESIAAHEYQLTTAFLEWCFSKSWIRVVGNTYSEKRLPSPSEIVPVVSIELENLTPDRAADLLNIEFMVAVRAGLHCAFKAHETLNTVDRGLLRFSFGYFNTFEQLDTVFKGLERVVR
ncbi:MAG: aminotransferase class V-fold PLP-dependent enzyme [Candidatus Obscuribacterales bacterium]